jgi:hypothetical protein
MTPTILLVSFEAMSLRSFGVSQKNAISVSFVLDGVLPVLSLVSRSWPASAHFKAVLPESWEGIVRLKKTVA